MFLRAHRAPWQAIREWIPDDDAEPGGDLFDQRPNSGKPVEILREGGSILVLDLDWDHGERRTKRTAAKKDFATRIGSPSFETTR